MSQDMPEKTELFSVKDATREDWRGMISLLLIGGFIALLGICIIVKDKEMLLIISGALSGAVSSVITWYFLGKTHEESNRKVK